MTYYSGKFFRLCDRCGFRYYNTETRKEPETGMIVCKDCYDPRHPQDYVKSKQDKQMVKDARPEPTDTYLSTSNPVTADDL